MGGAEVEVEAAAGSHASSVRAGESTCPLPPPPRSNAESLLTGVGDARPSSLTLASLSPSTSGSLPIQLKGDLEPYSRLLHRATGRRSHPPPHLLHRPPPPRRATRGSGKIHAVAARSTRRRRDPMSGSEANPGIIPRGLVWICEPLSRASVLVRALVRSVVDGFNGTAFTYGQISNDKTSSMNGSDYFLLSTTETARLPP